MNPPLLQIQELTALRYVILSSVTVESIFFSTIFKTFHMMLGFGCNFQPSGLAYDQFRLEPSRLFNNSNSNSNGSYSNPVSTHAYIRLKDCSSSRSLGEHP